jgi:7-cyano-7-deazaguanine reductase
MSRLDNKIAGKHLGQKSDYAEKYDPSLLVAVPRQPNRDNIGVEEGKTPWKYAYDVWNCYEISSLLSNGQPFSGVGKLVYNGNSKCIVESKSLKLYLNSFNQTRTKASSVIDAYRELKSIIEKDLSALLETDARITITPSAHVIAQTLPLRDYLRIDNGHSLADFTNIDGYSTKDLTEYNENPDLLVVTPSEHSEVICVHSANLFSRCQITNQPDHGDLFIAFKAQGKFISPEDLNAYIASIRGHSCFHEPTVETIYKHIHDRLNPEYLMVGALYTRRGGISIGPIRASDEHLIPYNVVSHHIPHVKLPRE